MSSARRSKFALVLSRNPTVRPDQSRGNGGTATVCVDTTPTGLRTRICAMLTSSSKTRAGRRGAADSATHVGLERRRAGQQATERLVHLGHHRALHPDGHRLHRLGASHAVDDEGGRELLGALVGGGQSSQRQDLPARLSHGAIIPPGMVIALDVGTSSARATAYDHAGRRLEGRFHSESYTPFTTHDGGVEHDPARLLEAIATCLDAVAVVDHADPVVGVGVSTFWHGLCGFDRAGAAVTPVYMWADTRSTGDADLLRGALDADALHARTGCALHASYWPAKLRWLLRTRPVDTRRVARWGSFGEYLELALFGEAATSVSMASATGLLDQDSGRWDAEALAAAEIDQSRLFALTDRTQGRHGLRAPWARRWPALRSTAWFPAVGDGAASNIGSACVSHGRVALNVGTSAAMRIVTSTPVRAPRGLWRYRVDRKTFIVGGATSEGGNVFAWCENVLRLPEAARLEAALGAAAPDGHGLTVLPFLAGERSPGWRGGRHAVIAGLTLDSTALDILHAGLEAVALRLALIYQSLAPLAAPEHVIVASGGAIARSPVWPRMIADALGHSLLISRETEATSRGAAVLALHALGVRPSFEAPLDGDVVAPDPGRHARYRDAVARQQDLDEKV